MNPIKLVNPLQYPVAVLAGGILLVGGVRIANLPSFVMLPVAAAIATGGSSWLQTREPNWTLLENPQLERELQGIRQQAKLLADRAEQLRNEASQLLIESRQMDWLVNVQVVCDRALELPFQIDELSKRMRGSDSLLSPEELQKQLSEVEKRISSSHGVAREQMLKLAESLKRNIQLARHGQDARQAQVLNLSTLIQDSAGVLQQIQNKLRTADLTDAAATMELQELSHELQSFQENVALLVEQ